MANGLNNQVELFQKSFITPQSQQTQSASFDWEEYRVAKYDGVVAVWYCNYSEQTHWIHNMTVHGVNVVVAFDRLANETTLPTTTRTWFAKKMWTLFHRLWVIFEFFPIKEYRVVLNVTKKAGNWENEMGLSYSVSEATTALRERFRQEKLAHEIGHSWIGNMLRVKSNIGGSQFNVTWQESDKWITEGFDHLYGIIAMELQDALDLVNDEIRWCYNSLTEPGLDLPLVKLPTYEFSDTLRNSYYRKGGWLAMVFHQTLQRLNPALSLNYFMRELCRDFCVVNSTDNRNFSTSQLLDLLNSYSKLPNTMDDLFQKYVWDNKTITELTTVTESFFQTLRFGNEMQSFIMPLVDFPAQNGTDLSTEDASKIPLKFRFLTTQPLRSLEIKLDNGDWNSILSTICTNQSLSGMLVVVCSGQFAFTDHAPYSSKHMHNFEIRGKDITNADIQLSRTLYLSGAKIISSSSKSFIRNPIFLVAVVFTLFVVLVGLLTLWFRKRRRNHIPHSRLPTNPEDDNVIMLNSSGLKLEEMEEELKETRNKE